MFDYKWFLQPLAFVRLPFVPGLQVRRRAKVSSLIYAPQYCSLYAYFSAKEARIYLL
jgi:hypothetical protein